MTAYSVPANATDVPMVLCVSQDVSGGVTGLAPTVAMRKGGSPTLYLDWGDNTFKASGWAQKYFPLLELERGNYGGVFSMVEIGAVEGDTFALQYTAPGYGEAVDLILCTSPTASADLTLLRKLAANRMVETPGNPGTLELYDDDGTTVIGTWTLADYTGGAVIGSVGAPARRGAKT
jgi:hypothetical protein